MHNCLLFFLFFTALGASSQGLHLPEHRVPLQTTTYSRLQAEAFSFTSNQAALASFKKPAFGIYGERKFMLEELSLFAASVALPTNSGNFGLAARRFGSAAYNESEAGLAYGLRLGEKAAVGAQFNYHSFKASGYGNTGFLSIEASSLFFLSDQLQGGFHIYRPAGNLKGKDGDITPASVYEAGLGYDVSDKLFLTAIGSKTEGLGMQLHAAVQYAFTNSLLCKAGITSGNASFYFGAGVMLPYFRLDAITSFHQHLGVSPGILLSFKPGSGGEDR